MTKLEYYEPFVLAVSYVAGWCAAMLTGLVFLRVRR